MTDRKRRIPTARTTGGFSRLPRSRGASRPSRRRAAASAGLLSPNHARRGRFLRVKRGLYRLADYPASPREEVLAAWLAAGRDEAVVSHETALDVLGLSDVVPERVHLTVPRSKRYRRASAGVAIHTTTRPLKPTDVVIRDGLPVTSPARSIADAAEAGTAPEQAVEAARQAIERGLATPGQLQATASDRGVRVRRLIERALDESRT